MCIDKSTWGHEQGSPSNTVEEVKEMTAEERFYNCGEGVSEEAHQYIVHLERKLKTQRELVKDLLSKTSDNLTLHEKALRNMLHNLNS